MPGVRRKADVAFEDGRIVVRLGGGVSFSFPIARNRLLEGATQEQLANVEVDEDGLHWPEIDEDLSFAGLLRGDWGQFVRTPQEAMCVCEGDAPKYGGENKEGRMPIVYLDSSFVSHWVGQNLDDPREAAWHQASVVCWRRMEGKVAPVVSEVVSMNDDPVLTELEETRRELWAESDGTLAGYARMVDRLGREYREDFLAEQTGTSAEIPDYSGAMCVCEGDAPKYGVGETSGSARDAGAEGE